MEFPEHIAGRMVKRGATREDVEATVAAGWPCDDARAGRECRTLVSEYNAVWDGKWYAEKEVTVYYVREGDRLILVTVNTRYGSGFPRGGHDED